MLDRIRAGFGVSNTDKFGAFADEVVRACEGRPAKAIDGATERLLNQNTRPNIGDVRRALNQAAGALVSDLPQITDEHRVGLALSWVRANVGVRFVDYPEVFGRPDPGLSPFVTDGALEAVVVNFPRHILEGALGVVEAAQRFGMGAKDRRARSVAHALTFGPEIDEARRRAAYLRDIVRPLRGGYAE